MDPARYQRLRALYHEAFDVRPSDRASWLAEREPDTALCEEVQSLFATEVNDAFGERDLGAFAREVVEREPAHEPRSNLRTLGPYRATRWLGEGGAGRVFLARRGPDGPPVALKLLRTELAEAGLLRRFQREAALVQRLEHPGIARFLAAGSARAEFEDGTGRTVPYLVVEYVDGLTLQRHASAAHLDDPARVELIARVCDAVQCAHERGVVHRDLKPSNLLVEPSADGIGQPKVIDFGIARVQGVEHATGTATVTGTLLGTLPYMSPERVAAGDAELDPRSDVYSLGILLFELLTGRLPYPVVGQPSAVAARVILEQAPERLGAVDRRFAGALESIVGRALEKPPRLRYANAGELAADLRRQLAGLQVEAPPRGIAARAQDFARRHRVIAWALACLSIGLVVVAVLAATRTP